MTHVLIRRSGTLIDISPDGVNGLDPGIVDYLRPSLTYEHKTLLRGHERFMPDGTERSMDIEVRRMFELEEGRLTTGFGFLTTIVEQLRAAGITPHYYDLSPERQRPDCYEADWENCQRYVEFRPKQEECLRYITQNQTGLINAAMGFGKTFMFEALCHLYPKAKFHIVVKPKDVAQRIVRQLSRSIPNVGQVGGGKNWIGDRVTVFTAGSVHKTDGDCDFLIGDEVHLLMTGKAARGLGEGWRFARNFGFTATPEGRMDGSHAMLECFFGRQIFYLSYQEAVALGLVVPINVRWLPIHLGGTNPAANKTGVPKMRWGIWRNDERNRVIAEDVRSHYGPEHQVLILVATIDHAIHLWKHLPEFELCYANFKADDIERYKRNDYLPQNFVPTTPDRREQMRDAFAAGTLKKVIATDVWATGVDFEQLQVIYRTDARESEILDAQAPGRVSRIHPESGKEMGEVIDCYDIFDKGLARKSQTRKGHYRALGWSQDWPAGRRQINHA